MKEAACRRFYNHAAPVATRKGRYQWAAVGAESLDILTATTLGVCVFWNTHRQCLECDTVSDRRSRQTNRVAQLLKNSHKITWYNITNSNSDALFCFCARLTVMLTKVRRNLGVKLFYVWLWAILDWFLILIVNILDSIGVDEMVTWKSNCAFFKWLISFWHHFVFDQIFDGILCSVFVVVLRSFFISS